MKYKGLTRRDRYINQRQRSFDRWFESAPNKEDVYIDGGEQEAVFQDINQANDSDLSDYKYMITRSDIDIKVGSYIKWRDQNWMIFSVENETVDSHNQAKIKEANHNVKWLLLDGRISGNGEGYNAYVKNQTLYTLGVQMTSSANSWIVNAKMMMFMQDNAETKEMRIGQRIFIGNEVYKIMFKDGISRQGLINYLLEEDFVNLATDNLELHIANYYGNKEEEPPTEPNISQITGESEINIGQMNEYHSDDDVESWTITDIDHVIKVIEQTKNVIKVQVLNKYQCVGSQFTIIATMSNGNTGTKAVKVVNDF
jgi:hypothetical protein